MHNYASNCRVNHACSSTWAEYIIVFCYHYLLEQSNLNSTAFLLSMGSFEYLYSQFNKNDYLILIYSRLTQNKDISKVTITIVRNTGDCSSLGCLLCMDKVHFIVKQTCACNSIILYIGLPVIRDNKVVNCKTTECSHPSRFNIRRLSLDDIYFYDFHGSQQT